MTVQGTPETNGAPIDPRLLAGAEQVLAEHGLEGVTLERLSAASGLSRMTLHRRRVTTRSVVAALVEAAAGEYLAGVLPALTSTGDAEHRLRAVLVAIFDVADRHLALLAGLFPRPDSVFHEPKAGPGPVDTDELFSRPIARLLRDGAADGTLRAVPDPDRAAVVLFNVVGWGYVHLRHAQRWGPEQARADLLDLGLRGLLPAS